MARLSRELVRLKDDVPVSEEMDSFALSPPNLNVLRPFLLTQEFKSLLKRIEGELGVIATPDSVPSITSSITRSYELVQTVEDLIRWVNGI